MKKRKKKTQVENPKGQLKVKKEKKKEDSS